MTRMTPVKVPALTLQSSFGRWAAGLGGRLALCSLWLHGCGLCQEQSRALPHAQRSVCAGDGLGGRRSGSSGGHIRVWGLPGLFQSWKRGHSAQVIGTETRHAGGATDFFGAKSRQGCGAWACFGGCCGCNGQQEVVGCTALVLACFYGPALCCVVSTAPSVMPPSEQPWHVGV